MMSNSVVSHKSAISKSHNFLSILTRGFKSWFLALVPYPCPQNRSIESHMATLCELVRGFPSSLPFTLISQNMCHNTFIFFRTSYLNDNCQKF